MDEALRFVVVEEGAGDTGMLRDDVRRSFPHSLITPVAWHEDALRSALNEYTPDVVVCGCRQPEADALAMLRFARELAPGAALVVVAATDDAEQAVSCLKAGADDWLPRGRWYRLAAAVREAIERRRETAARLLWTLSPFAASDGPWDWNLRRNEVSYSPRFKEMLGFGPDDMGRHPQEWLSLVHPEDVERVGEALRGGVWAGQPEFEMHYRILHKDGAYRWMQAKALVLRDSQGQPYRVAGVQTDVTDRRVAQERLKHQATHDALTGVPGRQAFLERLEHALREARRTGYCTSAVFVIDLDRFRLVNDGYGHAEGDLVLQELTRRLSQCLRRLDTLARLGADSFAILVGGINELSAARQFAARIEDALRAPFHVAGQELFVTVSIGIAPIDPGYEAASSLLRDADATVHMAKARGGRQCEIFHPGIHEQTRRRLETESDLRRALDGNQMSTHYQPTVCLTTGDLVGFEALARWEHPVRGLVLPGDFISLAEDTGLIVPLGQQVVRNACRFLRDIEGSSAQSPISVSVNLSAREFGQGDLVRQFETALREARVPGRRLRVEITESLILNDLNMASRKLAGLREMGIAVDVDDFGTGFSSLHYLRTLPVDAIKIDREFVSRLGQGGKETAIVRSIVSLSRSLGIGCVAEGVSTHEEVTRLRGLGCPRAQGFFFAQPSHAQTARALVGRRWSVAEGPPPALPSPTPDAPMLPGLLDRLDNLLDA